MISDYFILPWKEIGHRKLRYWLTLLGVFIGIAAIISLITLGQGLQDAISGQIQSLGSDKLFIMPKGNLLTAGLSTDAIKITTKDLDVIKSTSGVKSATGMLYTTARIEFNDQVRYFFNTGLPTSNEEISLISEAQSFKIQEGRFIQKGDKYKIALGNAYLDPKYFGKAIQLGDKIKVQDQEFKVVGILQKIGSPPDDQNTFIPLEVYWDIFDKKDELGIIIVRTQAGEDPEKVAEVLKKELRKSRGLKEGKEDFSIETPAKFAESFATILDMVQIVLIGIAAISLLVGGIGIMNTMYTSVLQRTKEIGVMKAIGAKNSHILALVLVESGFYGLGGGIVGVIIGIGFAKIVEFLMAIFLGPGFMTITINWWLVLGTLTFSFVIGCLSGIAPAYRASKLSPVDSLRYE